MYICLSDKYLDMIVIQLLLYVCGSCSELNRSELICHELIASEVNCNELMHYTCTLACETVYVTISYNALIDMLKLIDL